MRSALHCFVSWMIKLLPTDQTHIKTVKISSTVALKGTTPTQTPVLPMYELQLRKHIHQTQNNFDDIHTTIQQK